MWDMELNNGCMLTVYEKVDDKFLVIGHVLQARVFMDHKGRFSINYPLTTSLVRSISDPYENDVRIIVTHDMIWRYKHVGKISNSTAMFMEVKHLWIKWMTTPTYMDALAAARQALKVGPRKLNWPIEPL
ncbi:hypothetical protein FLL45_19795 [Aliikangiella marina]|uniref:Uncharacterized protein n=1 Tax=Aliikangiella marina TaxID=1712262 RepID=A0A545T2F7_9GAMM|nr:hypothetical protein [Aliikangiella marina]TQV71401.1 hypothetical protein FLL45_19795 [Aliikangiella marina]